MDYTVIISELSKNVRVHHFDCMSLIDSEEDDISLYCKTYEEAWSWVSLGDFKNEYLSEDCNCCNPGNWYVLK